MSHDVFADTPQLTRISRAGAALRAQALGTSPGLKGSADEGAENGDEEENAMEE